MTVCGLPVAERGKLSMLSWPFDSLLLLPRLLLHSRVTEEKRPSGTYRSRNLGRSMRHEQKIPTLHSMTLPGLALFVLSIWIACQLTPI